MRRYLMAVVDNINNQIIDCKVEIAQSDQHAMQIMSIWQKKLIEDGIIAGIYGSDAYLFISQGFPLPT